MVNCANGAREAARKLGGGLQCVRLAPPHAQKQTAYVGIFLTLAFAPSGRTAILKTDMTRLRSQVRWPAPVPSGSCRFISGFPAKKDAPSEIQRGSHPFPGRLRKAPRPFHQLDELSVMTVARMRRAAAGFQRDKNVLDRVFINLKSLHRLRTARTFREGLFLRLRRFNFRYKFGHGFISFVGWPTNPFGASDGKAPKWADKG
jgi:hypothetical protein